MLSFLLHAVWGSFANGTLGRGSSVLVCTFALLVQLPPAFAEAPRSASDVVILRGGEAESELGSKVDQLLLSTLIDDAGLVDSYFSEIPLADAQLLSGCRKPVQECLGRLAAVLGGQRLLLREFILEDEGQVRLTLSAQDGPIPASSRRVHARLLLDRPDAFEPVVRNLIRELYLPDSHRSPGPPPTARARADTAGFSALRVVGLSSAGMGASLLVTGLVFGVSSRRAHDAYQKIDIRKPEDVDHARELLDRSRARATAANFCFAGGGALLAMGIGLVLVERARSSKRRDPGPTLSLTRSAHGAEIWLSGTFGRAR